MQDKKTVNSNRENKKQNKTIKPFQSIILQPEKTAFKNEGKVKIYSDIRMLKGLISIGSVLLETVQ